MLPPILVAEDTPFDLEFTLFALAKCDIPNPIVVVRDGQAALDYLYRQNQYATRTPGNPGVILLDIKMPKVDGLEVLKTVRATPQFSSVPIVMLTHSEQVTDVHRARLLGIDRYIVKPIELDQFATDICKVISDVLP